MLALALVLLLTNTFVWHKGAGLAGDNAANAAGVPQKSVAVLPLTNESGDKDRQYFSDGLSEDLITALSQFSGLKVINRDPGVTLLLTDPSALGYRNDPRFAAFCKKVGLPTTTDAKALP